MVLKFLVCIIFVCVVTSQVDKQCVSSCEAGRVENPSVYLCSNFNETMYVLRSSPSCYFWCNVTAYYPGSCNCPNDCFSQFGHGMCQGNQCSCQDGWGGRDCSYNMNVPLIKTGLPSLAFDAVYPSTLANTNYHPIFNVSIVSQIHITVDETKYLKMIHPQGIWNAKYVDTTFRFISENSDVTLPDVGMKVKGAWSRMNRKKGFKFEFDTKKHPGRKLMNLVSKIAIKGADEDLGGVLSLLVSQIHQSMGNFAQRSSFMTMWVNGVYFGMYWMAEEFEKEFFKERSLPDNVGLYKCGYDYASLAYLGDKQSLYRDYQVYIKALKDWFTIYDKKLGDKKDFKLIKNLAISLVNFTRPTFASEIVDLVNVDGFFRAQAIDIAVISWDAYTVGNNNYLLYENNQKIEYISQDFDETLTLSDKMRNLMAQQNIYNFDNISAKPVPAPLFTALKTHFRSNFTAAFRGLLQIYGSDQMMKWLDTVKKFVFPLIQRDYFWKINDNRSDELWLSNFDLVKKTITIRRDKILQEIDPELTREYDRLYWLRILAVVAIFTFVFFIPVTVGAFLYASRGMIRSTLGSIREKISPPLDGDLELEYAKQNDE